MNFFKYKEGELYCEDVPVKRIAEECGTPAYVYSYRTIQNHYRVFTSAFSALPHIVCYAVKANSNLSVLRLLAKEGAGADVVSAGELYRALKAGIPREKIVYAGVGKTRKEIAYALDNDILMFNVESAQELEEIEAAARDKKKKAKIALRVNPGVDPKTHPYTATGLMESKFGLDFDAAISVYKKAARNKYLEPVGVHTHIGSQLTDISPFVDALKSLVDFLQKLEGEGIRLDYIDIGGGLGITYESEEPPQPHEFAQAVMPIIKSVKATLILEPGRVIVGNAGALICRVIYEKETPYRRFLIVDSGMNDLIRPALYEAYHEILPVVKSDMDPVKVDVVGPICESGDFLAKERFISGMKKDDLMAIMSAGAYGFTMSSNYNSRPRIPEVMVKDSEYYIVRERENFKDLIRGERIEEALFKDDR